MALQTSGAISLNDIAGEFGGSTPHSLSEYYGVATGIPSSGQISISQFYGKSNIVADYYPSISYSGTTNWSSGAFGNIFDGSLSTFAARSNYTPSSSTLNQHGGKLICHWNNGAISAGSSLRFSAIWPSSNSRTVPIYITDGSGNVHQSSVTSQGSGVVGVTAGLWSLNSSYPYASISKIEFFNGYNPVFVYGIERSGSMLILP